MQSPFELLWFDPELAPQSPEEQLPLAVSYREYGADLISRTSWDPNATASVVYGKSGRETNHDDNDVGQLCIDGFGERLIVDVGKPEPIYPVDYFSTTQYHYYTRSSRGHNVLEIGGEEMIAEPNAEARGKIMSFWSEDTVGSTWTLDLSPVYGNADRVSRRVAHLFPGIVLVHDQAELPAADSIVLRWHTVAPPELMDHGTFTSRNKRAAVVAKVLSLNGQPLQCSTGHHEFKPPYHLTRQEDPLEQHYDPFVQIETFGKKCSLLSLFAVVENTEELPKWEETEEGWTLVHPDATYRITRRGNTFEIVADNGKGRILLE